jgi:hypothetical protein
MLVVKTLFSGSKFVVFYTGGAFPPYDGLRKKFINANSFEEAFALRPPRDRSNGHDITEELSPTVPLASSIVSSAL